MFLYVVTNLKNGKQYVGVAQDYQRRWREYKAGYGSKLVYQAIKKYGIGNFEFIVMCKGTKEYVSEMEIRASYSYPKYESTFWLQPGRWGSISSGWKHTDEARKRMSENHTGKVLGPHSDATKQKISASRQKYKRGNHPRASRITIDGVGYQCIRDAAEDIGIPYSMLCDKQRKAKSTEFFYQPKGVLTPTLYRRVYPYGSH